MESFTPPPHDDKRDQILPDLQIIPSVEEKRLPSISDIKGGLEIIDGIIKEEKNEEDKKRNEKGRTLH